MKKAIEQLLSTSYLYIKTVQDLDAIEIALENDTEEFKVESLKSAQKKLERKLEALKCQCDALQTMAKASIILGMYKLMSRLLSRVFGKDEMDEWMPDLESGV